LPDNLKSGIENLSGMSMDGVLVHYNSSKPAQLQALAYTQGVDIYVAPGQEKHLPHEGWHVVQQMQGRVQPTFQMKGMGVGVNDDPGLEREADEMGGKALEGKRITADFVSNIAEQNDILSSTQSTQEQLVRHQDLPETVKIVQRAVGFELEIGEIRTYQKNFFYQPKKLNKKDKLLTGTGFTLEADEMPTYSDMEFVTDAFPETTEGGRALFNALQKIDWIINILAENPSQEVSANDLRACGTPVDNRFLHLPQNHQCLTGKPQVTAGIKLDAMNRFLSDIAERGITPGDTAPANNAARIFGGQLTPNFISRDKESIFAGMPDVSKAQEATRRILDESTHDGIRGPELIALVTQLVMYLVAEEQGSPGYGKLISGGIMSRTDFATVFKLLTEKTQKDFKEAPERFIDIVIPAVSIVVGRYVAPEKPVFEGGLYNDPGMYKNNPKLYKADLLPELKRRDWLMGIINGIDYLTAKDYPGGPEEKAEIESLGGYGSNIDELSTNPSHSIPAPIIEIRGLKPLYARLFMPMASATSILSTQEE
jgi:hypothetical protein